MTSPEIFSREMSLRLEPVESLEQINELSRLADIIWHEYYLPVLGPEQVAYMLENIQSKANMEKDIEIGKLDYFLIKSEGQSAGYLAIQLRQDNLFISKLYLLKEARGKGYAYQIMEQMVELAKKEKKKALELTVNKHNEGSIAFYEKYGFVRTESIVSPIGGGFVMDDYVYQYPLTPTN
ncbi:GNAT family N-acetyltransferase [Trichococcus ilyis]|jgi:ribosomal protein S18 acetylase RimI-like enzyme|uniref:Acyl-coa n-acyltransferase n=1 Tax=Trichococcus ilyis TaxID=640938 RepID=A0A143Z114_9LACT|nr:GNAT family N-acetyltransferase [Trichococcus ilyis]CZR03693.1 acyl-coa n-acyltransferase [Trichococcus ilyis]SEJ42233.1 Ribosomal protein S18 acetylase RimI [Trichococcus ilyis]